MQYGSPGAGSTPHLSCEMFNAAIGVSVTHVPYRSGGAAMQDLLAGRTDYQCQGSRPRGRRSKAADPGDRNLAKDRSPIVPTLVSAHEQGVTDFDASIWYALFLPEGHASDPPKASLSDTGGHEHSIRRGASEGNGATIVARTRRSQDYLQKFVEIEIEKWGAAIKAAGVTENHSTARGGRAVILKHWEFSKFFEGTPDAPKDFWPANAYGNQRYS